MPILMSNLKVEVKSLDKLQLAKGLCSHKSILQTLLILIEISEKQRYL
jgi:hypothetical protein